MSHVEKIGSNTDTFTSLFTNFDGKFKGRLSAVIPSHIGSSSSSIASENAPISAKYDCRVKVEYHKDVMTLVEEGMVLAVKNFKASSTEKKMHWNIQGTHSEARKDPRIGIIKMFENAEQKIPIYVNLDHIVRYHFGVFSFTGGGKSCLLSNVLRRILLHTKDTKIVIFDISSEYPFLLMDLLADPTIPSKVVLESPIKSPDQFYVSVVKPKDFEDDVRVKQGLSKIFDRGIVTHYIKPQYQIPRYSEIFEELSQLKNESTGKPHYINAVEEIHQRIFNYLEVKALQETQFIDEARFVTLFA